MCPSTFYVREFNHKQIDEVRLGLSYSLKITRKMINYEWPVEINNTLIHYLSIFYPRFDQQKNWVVWAVIWGTLDFFFHSHLNAITFRESHLKWHYLVRHNKNTHNSFVNLFLKWWQRTPTTRTNKTKKNPDLNKIASPRHSVHLYGIGISYSFVRNTFFFRVVCFQTPFFCDDIISTMAHSIQIFDIIQI